jgi:transaldolase
VRTCELAGAVARSNPNLEWALAAPLTINTVPENTLKALADHGRIDAILDAGGGDSATVVAEFRSAGTDVDALSSRLQAESEALFVASWNELMKVIASKSAAMAKAGWFGRGRELCSTGG